MTDYSLISALLITVPLMVLGVHIGVALILGSLVGIYVFIGSWQPGLQMFLLQTLDVASSYTLMVIPLFIFLGSLASTSGITTKLFTMFHHWLGRVHGGLAMATIATCAGMASITGSSVATSAAMTKIALPELRRLGYDEKLSLGTIASGGTLSIMIPPSITLVLYAVFADQSVGKMLVAGVVPGAILTAFFCLLIYLMCLVNPKLGPRAPALPWIEMFRSIPGILPFVSVVGAVVAGILFGIWTPVESAAVAVVIVAALAFANGSVNLKGLFLAALEAMVTSGSIFIIVIGSMLFSNLLALNGAGQALTTLVTGWNLEPIGLFMLLIVTYIVLGMFMEVSSLMALSIPLVMPLVFAAGWDPIWFGVIIVLLMELAMVTPPVGLNLFAVKTVASDVSLMTIIAGSVPFWIITAATIFLLYFWPEVVLLLPNLI